MKNIKYTDWVIIILTFIIIVLITRGCYLQKENKYYQELNLIQDNVIKKHRNTHNQEISKTQVILTSLVDLQASRDSQLLELKQEIGGLKNLIATLKITDYITGTINTVSRDTVFLIKGDTMKAESIPYSDAWLTFEGLKVGKTFTAKYKIKDELQITNYWHRESIFKSPVLMVQAKMINPNTTLADMKPIIVQPLPKKWYETKGFAVAIGGLFGYLAGRKF